MYLPYINLRTKHELKKYLPNIHQKHVPTTNFPNSLFLVNNDKQKKSLVNSSQ